MPFLKVLSTENQELGKITQYSSLRPLNCKTKGFTLIEIALSLFLIIAILAILFSASGTYITTLGSNYQSLAAKIASRDIENLRKTAFASLPSCPSPTGCVISDTDIAKLPSGSATQTLADYGSSTKIKQVTVTVKWTDKNAPKQINLETLIAENGL